MRIWLVDAVTLNNAARCGLETLLPLQVTDVAPSRETPLIQFLIPDDKYDSFNAMLDLLNMRSDDEKKN